MNKTIEALKLAEWALLTTQNALLFSAAGSDKSMYVEAINDADKALAAIREALAEPVKQEPVAWIWQSVDLDSRSIETGLLFNRGVDDENTDWTPLYAAPVDAKAIRAEAREERTNELMQLFLDPENQPTQFGTATLEYREEESKAIRAEALEEAAKVCDDESRYSNDAECCAAVIRGLK